jgi:hypothetical protein
VEYHASQRQCSFIHCLRLFLRLQGNVQIDSPSSTSASRPTPVQRRLRLPISFRLHSQSPPRHGITRSHFDAPGSSPYITPTTPNSPSSLHNYNNSPSTPNFQQPTNNQSRNRRRNNASPHDLPPPPRPPNTRLRQRLVLHGKMPRPQPRQH